MIALIHLLMCSQLVVCSAVLQNRIYGGQKAPLGFLPHQVGLFNIIPGFPNLLCGGVILDSTHVLTAAHCAYNVGSNFSYGIQTANFRPGIDYSFPSAHFATKVSIHPSYIASNTEANRTDAAIFTISPPFVFSASIKPVTLPLTSVYETAGVTGTVSGYGLINETFVSQFNAHCRLCVQCGSKSQRPGSSSGQHVLCGRASAWKELLHWRFWRRSRC